MYITYSRRIYNYITRKNSGKVSVACNPNFPELDWSMTQSVNANGYEAGKAIDRRANERGEGSGQRKWGRGDGQKEMRERAGKVGELNQKPSIQTFKKRKNSRRRGWCRGGGRGVRRIKNKNKKGINRITSYRKLRGCSGGGWSVGWRKKIRKIRKIKINRITSKRTVAKGDQWERKKINIY